MDTRDLRAAVARKLGMPDVPGPVWAELRQMADVDGPHHQESIREIAAHARSYLRVLDAGGAARRAADDPPVDPRLRDASPSPFLSELEYRRLVALDEYAAIVESASDEVRGFRNRFLGGQALPSLEAACDLVESRPAAQLPAEHWDTGFLPSAGGALATVPRTLLLRRDSSETLPRLSWFRRDFATVREIPVIRGTVLDELRRCAEAVVERCHWHPASAALLILTGVRPFRLPFRASAELVGGDYIRATISITAEAWLSPETVARVYRVRQRQILGHRAPRPVSLRSLEFVRFLASYAELPGPLPSWRRRMDEWNARYPQWPYTSVRNFQKDFNRAVGTILEPRYRL